MNSPLQRRKVRLRGLGGLAACGVLGTCASATRGGLMVHSTTLMVQMDGESEREVDQILSSRLPNSTTRQSLHDAETRRNLTPSASTTALFAALGIAS
jgi:hypothetical protein